MSTDVTVQKLNPEKEIKETITHHLSELGRRTVDKQLVAAQKMLLKTETQQTFVNGLLGFITLGIYTPLEARVYCSQ